MPLRWSLVEYSPKKALGALGRVMAVVIAENLKED
jgi:hypothetical protein